MDEGYNCTFYYGWGLCSTTVGISSLYTCRNPTVLNAATSAHHTAAHARRLHAACLDPSGFLVCPGPFRTALHPTPNIPV